MSVPAYPAYKESGVEWLGAVPAHWEVTRLKRACEVFPSNVDKKSADGQTAVRLCNYTDVYYNDVILADMPFMEATATDEQIGRFTLRRGDTIFTKDSETADDIARSAYVLEDLPGVVCGYHLSIARPQGATVGAFIKRFFDSAPARAYFQVKANGLTRVGLGQYAVDNVPIALPPPAEQAAIAAFLDRETGKIDALVEEQRRLIALLKEKRQAVISHAVTKGLNPQAPLKPSGIDWLGDIPAHWEVRKVGSRYHVQLGRMLNADRAEGEHLRPYLRVFDVQWHQVNVEDLPVMDFPPDAQDRYRLEAGDLLVNEGGSYVGRSAIWRGDLAECYYQKALHRLRARDPNADTAEFLVYVMEAATKGGVFVAGGNQTTIDHLTADQLHSHRFAFPPIDEQRTIARHLALTCDRMDDLLREAEAAIALLQERRAALISAAVTGKIDVRTAADVVAIRTSRERARSLVGTAIIEHMAVQPAFGRVRLQKTAFIVEAHVGVGELQGAYMREAAGPHDRKLVDDMERGAFKIAGIETSQAGGVGSAVSYRCRRTPGMSRGELEAFLGPKRTAEFDRVLRLFADLDRDAAEAVATLYAVWNDALMDGQQPGDDAVIDGFLNDWHPEKREKFRPDSLKIWLGWMRRNGLVPSGQGPRTRQQGRLF